MMNPLMTPEGIDTISFVVNPIFVNRLFWQGSFEPYITLRQYGGMTRFFRVDVQFEALDMFGNIRAQAVSILTRLHSQGTMCFPGVATDSPQSDVWQYINQNLGTIAKLTALDFFFDFARPHIQKRDIPSKYPTTNYSHDHSRSKSLWILYDRSENLKRQRHIPVAVVDAMPYPMRLEMRLRRQNCDYLSFQNLNGSYYDIVYRYHNFIAKSWRKYTQQIGCPQMTDYHYIFNSILWLANQGTIPMAALCHSDTCFGGYDRDT